MQFDLTPAQRTLQGRARELARGPIAERAAEIDRTEQYPWDHVDLLKEAGFFGMTIPRDRIVTVTGGVQRVGGVEPYFRRRQPHLATGRLLRL